MAFRRGSIAALGLGLASVIAFGTTGSRSGAALAGGSNPVAFPGAEGFGAGASGGRGGDVMIVDTLEAFGPGSLGEALDPDDCGPRIVVFRVSGVIEVPDKHDLELGCGDLTIAGQTAPGAGITVNGRIDAYGADPAGNIVIRHLRVRPPPLEDGDPLAADVGAFYDALQLSNNPNLILDHISLSWGSDETLDLFENATDATVQWSTIEASNLEGQEEGPHNYGLIVGSDSPRVTVHHVLFAHHRSRCPAMSAGPAELRNSVIYDCQDGFVHHNPAEGEFHIAGNTFIQGPNHDDFTPFYFDDEEPGGSTYWLDENDIQAPDVYEGVVDDITGTPLAEVAFEGADPDQVRSSPSDFSAESATYVPVSMQSPTEAYTAVLAQAGAFPRDVVTRQTIGDVETGGGSWGAGQPDDLLEGLSPAAPPADEDGDGMADSWETDRGLDPTDGDDHGTVMASGYTAIEDYVNELSAAIVGAEPPPSSATPPAAGDEDDDGTASEDDQQAAGDQASDSDDNDDDSPALAVAIVALVVAIGGLGVSLYVLRLVKQPRPGGDP